MRSGWHECACTSDEALYTVLIDLDPVQQELLPGMIGQADVTLS